MYIALKPCNFGAGHNYIIGETIPEEVIAPSAKKRLISMGYIAEVEGVADTVVEGSETVIVSDTTLTILVKTDKGEVAVEPTDKGIQNIFTALIGNASEAESIIKQMDDCDALFLLHLADSRKSVKAAAETRVKELSEEAGDN